MDTVRLQSSCSSSPVQLARLWSPEGRAYLSRNQVNQLLCPDTPERSFVRACYPAHRQYVSHFCQGAVLRQVIALGAAQQRTAKLALVTVAQAVAGCRVRTHAATCSFARTAARCFQLSCHCTRLLSSVLACIMHGSKLMHAASSSAHSSAARCLARCQRAHQQHHHQQHSLACQLQPAQLCCQQQQ